MTNETGDFAKQGGHWYLADGSPFYTIVGKNGKTRAVTLRDARPIGAVPSVTGIIACASAPQLEKWKRNQLLLAALTLPVKPSESEIEWLGRVEQDWQQEGRAAAEKGTRIHAAIEQYYRDGHGEPVDIEWVPWIAASHAELVEHCGERQRWSAERSFADRRGYGGKTDLHSGEWVVDVKTKDGSPDGKLYDQHIMQLAAYREGLGLIGARAGILFVQREHPAATLIEASAQELDKGFEMFKALLAFWKARNQYFPERAQEAVEAAMRG